MTALETTVAWLSIFAIGSACVLAFVIWLIRKPFEPYDIEHMVKNSEMQRAVTTITYNGNEMEI